MSNSNSRPIVLAAATAATAAASYWVYQSVSSYGWEGTLRYVWEGDPYTPQVREYMDILDRVDDSRLQQEELIWTIEEALERARLDSVDDASATTSNSTTTTTTTTSTTTSSKEVVKLWMSNFVTVGRGDLEKNLAHLSHILDKLAAQVDGVLVAAKDGADRSLTWMEIKRRKKLLSKQLVLAMERVDALLASFQVLQEQQRNTKKN